MSDDQSLAKAVGWGLWYTLLLFGWALAVSIALAFVGGWWAHVVWHALQAGWAKG